MMSNRMDTALRETFGDIAESAPLPEGIAQAAVVRARRQRRVRIGQIGGGAVACAAAIAVTVAVLPSNKPPAQVAAVQGRMIVAFNSVMGVPPSAEGASGVPLSPAADRDARTLGTASYSMLLNPATGQYEKLPYGRILPSPDNGRALVWQYASKAVGPQQTKVGVWERSTGNVRWFTVPAGNDWETGEWSRDGQKILFLAHTMNSWPLMIVADPNTMTTTSVQLQPPTSAADCLFLTLVWTPDATGVAETVYCKAGGTDYQVSQIRFYDLAGNVKRSMPATATLAEGMAYSPDGALILLSDAQHERVIVIDSVTGAERARLPLSPSVGPGPDDLVGWYDAGHLAIYTVTDGTNPQAGIRVVDLSGTTTATLPAAFYPAGDRVLGTVGN